MNKMINERINLFGLVLFYLYICQMENKIVTGLANIELIEDLFKRDENGFPLLEDGTIDWEQTSLEKQQVLDRYEMLEAREAGFKKFRKCNNAQRPKPRRKKKKSKNKRK